MAGSTCALYSSIDVRQSGRNYSWTRQLLIELQDVCLFETNLPEASRIQLAMEPDQHCGSEVERPHGFRFAPAVSSVAVGSTITWTNRDDVPHNIVSTEGRFKSPVLDTDQQFSHRFDSPGTYKYFCSIHPKMTGQIAVAG